MIFLEECIHCEGPSKTLFCPACQELIIPNIQEEKRTFYREISLFSPFSPIHSLLKIMKRGSLRSYLSVFACFFLQPLLFEKPCEKLVFFEPFSLQNIFVKSLLYELVQEISKRANIPFERNFFQEKKKELNGSILINLYKKEGEKTMRQIGDKGKEILLMNLIDL